MNERQERQLAISAPRLGRPGVATAFLSAMHAGAGDAQRRESYSHVEQLRVS